MGRAERVRGVPAGAVPVLRQLHVVVAGRAVPAARPAAAADAAVCELVLLLAVGGGAARAAAAGAHLPAVVRGGRVPAGAELGRGSADHLPHHRSVRSRGVRYLHDAAAGGLGAVVVPGVRPPRVGGRRGGGDAGVLVGVPPPVLAQTPRAAGRAGRQVDRLPQYTYK